MGGVIGQLESWGDRWKAGPVLVRKLPKFRIFRVYDDMWLLLRPDGWAFRYIDFSGCVKWLDYSIARYVERRS